MEEDISTEVSVYYLIAQNNSAFLFIITVLVCTFSEKSTKIIQGAETRYRLISSLNLYSSRSDSLSPKNPFLFIMNPLLIII